MKQQIVIKSPRIDWLTVTLNDITGGQATGSWCDELLRTCKSKTRIKGYNELSAIPWQVAELQFRQLWVF